MREMQRKQFEGALRCMAQSSACGRGSPCALRDFAFAFTADLITGVVCLAWLGFAWLGLAWLDLTCRGH